MHQLSPSAGSADQGEAPKQSVEVMISRKQKTSYIAHHSPNTSPVSPSRYAARKASLGSTSSLASPSDPKGITRELIGINIKIVFFITFRAQPESLGAAREARSHSSHGFVLGF